MTNEEHRLRHVLLHQHLDELLADFMRHHPEQKNYLDMRLRQLVEWSHEQTIAPEAALHR